ncbi:hypothetical protein [Candidatus Nitrosotenuis sp. DW1]|uniref:hypothetical protein n=1 Tax=Candidatus Nitrosotenuis sp. DW1 TaxID=2259672 RepID=UPI0015C8A2AD|nr:hypothetical protein [Candidatus Nitrosotenuis sp. DW1]
MSTNRHNRIQKVEIGRSICRSRQGNALEISRSFPLKRQSLAIILPFFLCLVAITFVPSAFAIDDVQWGDIFVPDTQRTITDGGPGAPILIQAENDTLSGNAVIDQVTVHVYSTADPTGIDLILTEDVSDSGFFTNNHLVFLTSSSNKFQIGDTITITIEDKCTVPTHGNCNSALVETLPIAFGATIKSDSALGGISLSLIETGANTGLFTTKVKLTSGPTVQVASPGISELHVSSGDAIRITDSVTGSRTNGYILPISGGNGALVVSIASPGAFVTYGSVLPPSSLNVITDGLPGRGGGGLVSPSLVVDIVASIASSGGLCSSCTPPTLGVDRSGKRMVENGFSYNGNPVDVELFYTPYPLIKTHVGDMNNAEVKIYEESGIDNIKHISLAFGLGENQVLDDSRASIEIDREFGKNFTVSTIDPKRTLDSIRIETRPERCSESSIQQCLVVSIYHKFRAPLDFNMVATEIWDFKENSWQNYFNHGVEIDGQSINPPEQYIGIDRGHQVTITEISKNRAIDEKGNLWIFDKEWHKEIVMPEKTDRESTAHGFNRESRQFSNMVIEQQSIAEKKMDELTHGKQINKSNTSNSFSPVINYISRSEDLELQQRIQSEQRRANEWLLNRYFLSAMRESS